MTSPLGGKYLEVWGYVSGLRVSVERQDSTKAMGFILSLQLTRSLQWQILSPTWLGPTESHHSGADSSPGSSPPPGPLTFFYTESPRSWLKKSPSRFIESQHSTSPVLSRQRHVGKGLRPRPGDSGSLAPPSLF